MHYISLLSHYSLQLTVTLEDETRIVLACAIRKNYDTLFFVLKSLLGLYQNLDHQLEQECVTEVTRLFNQFCCESWTS